MDVMLHDLNYITFYILSEWNCKNMFLLCVNYVLINKICRNSCLLDNQYDPTFWKTDLTKLYKLVD